MPGRFCPNTRESLRFLSNDFDMNCKAETPHPARNLDFIFDEYLTLHHVELAPRLLSP